MALSTYNSTMPSTSQAIQAPTGGWHRLPAEIRLDIYRQMWKPTTIVISSEQFPQKLPVTLHLNYESREETLRHYHPYTVHFPEDPVWNRKKDHKFGYINPHLDIVHFASRLDRLAKSPLKLKFPGITQPLLRITIDQDDCSFDGRLLDSIQPIIRSIDVWSCPVECRGEEFLKPCRYRICRIPASMPRTPVARFEDTVFVPEYRLNTVQDQVPCTKPDCLSRFAYFKWRNVPEENQVITSLRPGLDGPMERGTLSEQLTPVNKSNASELRFPCAVSYWGNGKALDTLQRDKVLLFDVGHEAPATGTQKQGDVWVALKAVSPTQAAGQEVIMRALGYHQKVLMSDRVSSHPVWLAPAPDFSSIYMMIVRLGLGPMGCPWRGVCEGEIVHGVCDPSFTFEGQIHVASERHPLVSDHEYRGELGAYCRGRSMDVEGGKKCSVGFLAEEHYRTASGTGHRCD